MTYSHFDTVLAIFGALFTFIILAYVCFDTVRKAEQMDPK